MEASMKTSMRFVSPRIRFKNYSNSWELIALKDLLKLDSRPIDMDDEKEYQLVIVKRRYDGVVSRGIFKGRDVKVKSQFELRHKDFVISKRQIVHNACGIVPRELHGTIVSNEYCVFTPQKNLDILYFNYFCHQPIVSQSFFQSSIGVHIEKMLFKVPTWLKHRFYFPSLLEQQKIASFLSVVDEKIRQLTRKKELLEQYKKGVMQQIFSRKLRFKDENGKNYPEWEEKRLGEMAELLKGKGVSKKDVDKDGATPCVLYGELYTRYQEVIDEVVSKTNVPQKDLVISKANDVIIPSSGETQIDIATASCVLRNGIALGGDLNIIRSDINGVFLSYYLNQEKKVDIARMAQGNAVVHLYNSQLQHLRIQIPSKSEQRQIAEMLAGIDRRIRNLEKTIEQTQTFKKGLLQQMFV